MRDRFTREACYDWNVEMDSERYQTINIWNLKLIINKNNKFNNLCQKPSFAEDIKTKIHHT